MSKQWIVPGNIFEFLKLHSRTRPRLPRFARNRMHRRTNGEQVNHHEFAIVVPPSTQETAAWFPSHGERFAAIKHPRPIHTLVDRRCEILDLAIIEMLTNRQHATKQKRGIDRGEFTIPHPLSSFQIDEVVEESVFVRQSPREKAERLPHPFPDRRRLTVTARFPDTKASESKARCRNTGNSPLVAAVKQRAIPDLPSRGASFVPKKVERRALNFIQELIVRTAIRISLRLVKRLPPRRPRQRRKTGQTQKPQGSGGQHLASCNRRAQEHIDVSLPAASPAVPPLTRDNRPASTLFPRNYCYPKE